MLETRSENETKKREFYIVLKAVKTDATGGYKLWS